MSLRVEMSIITFDHHAVSRNFSAEICVVFESVYFLSKGSFFQDVTNSGNGERGTGNREPGTGVWELMYSGNPLESSKWRSKQKKMNFKFLKKLWCCVGGRDQNKKFWFYQTS